MGASAAVAVLAAMIVTLSLRSRAWRGFFGNISRAVRSEADHPRWDLLAQ
jgi:hypothetical protein